MLHFFEIIEIIDFVSPPLNKSQSPRKLWAKTRQDQRIKKTLFLNRKAAGSNKSNHHCFQWGGRCWVGGPNNYHSFGNLPQDQNCGENNIPETSGANLGLCTTQPLKWDTENLKSWFSPEPGSSRFPKRQDSIFVEDPLKPLMPVEFSEFWLFCVYFNSCMHIMFWPFCGFYQGNVLSWSNYAERFMVPKFGHYCLSKVENFETAKKTWNPWRFSATNLKIWPGSHLGRGSSRIRAEIVLTHRVDNYFGKMPKFFPLFLAVIWHSLPGDLSPKWQKMTGNGLKCPKMGGDVGKFWPLVVFLRQNRLNLFN